MRATIIFSIFLVFVSGCSDNSKERSSESKDLKENIGGPTLVVLGTIQDGGSPHPGCIKECCVDLFNNPSERRNVVSLGVIDPENKKNWLFDATPDITVQMKALHNLSQFKKEETPDAIFLTHAHIGHYSGLMYLGKEAMNTYDIAVYARPRMKTFLENNGPWSQLLALNNIAIQPLEENKETKLSSSIQIAAFAVPHRDEFSETVGYFIQGPGKRAMFIPDIDKWQKWERDIIQEIAKVDYVFIDGTFYDGKEIGYRDISQIPHPFVTESMDLFKQLSDKEKDKIYFIHLNHTNPLLDTASGAYKTVLKNGFHVAKNGQRLGL